MPPRGGRATPEQAAQVAAALKATRERLGLSQTDFERRVGMSNSSLHLIESGRSGISMALLFRMAAALDCNWDDLLGPPPAEGDEDPTWRAGYRAGVSDSLDVVRDLMNGTR